MTYTLANPLALSTQGTIALSDGVYGLADPLFVSTLGNIGFALTPQETIAAIVQALAWGRLCPAIAWATVPVVAQWSHQMGVEQWNDRPGAIDWKNHTVGRRKKT